MQCDYKISTAVRNGSTTVCIVRYYTGDITTETETDAKGNKTEVTRYRRTSKVMEETHEFEGTIEPEEVSKLVNPNLDDFAKDLSATPITAQSVLASLPPDAKDI